MNRQKPITALIVSPNFKSTVKDIIEPERVELQAVELQKVEIPDGNYTSIEISNARVDQLVANNISSDSGAIVRVVLKNSQLTGLRLPRGYFKNIQFLNCRMNVSNFRQSKFERCLFYNCVLNEADFGGSDFKNVRFEYCQLQQTEFSNCVSSRLEFESTSLAAIRGVAGLRGATISSENLIEVSPALANAFEIIITD